jgi:hypothetical protein
VELPVGEYIRVHMNRRIRERLRSLMQYLDHTVSALTYMNGHSTDMELTNPSVARCQIQEEI